MGFCGVLTITQRHLTFFGQDMTAPRLSIQVQNFIGCADQEGYIVCCRLHINIMQSWQTLAGVLSG